MPGGATATNGADGTWSNSAIFHAKCWRSQLRLCPFANCHTKRECPAVRIHVVEDDPLIVEFIVDTLREAGHEVLEARDGKEALAQCLSHSADVLLTDIQLQGHSTAGRPLKDTDWIIPEFQ